MTFCLCLTWHYSSYVFHFVTAKVQRYHNLQKENKCLQQLIDRPKTPGRDHRTRNNGLEKNKLGADLYSRRHFIACHSPSHWNTVMDWGEWRELLGASNDNLNNEVKETHRALPFPRTWLAYCGGNQGREYDPLVTGGTSRCVVHMHIHTVGTPNPKFWWILRSVF